MGSGEVVEGHVRQTVKIKPGRHGSQTIIGILANGLVGVGGEAVTQDDLALDFFCRLSCLVVDFFLFLSPFFGALRRFRFDESERRAASDPPAERPGRAFGLDLGRRDGDDDERRVSRLPPRAFAGFFLEEDLWLFCLFEAPPWPLWSFTWTLRSFMPWASRSTSSASNL